jgi:hypothetical protein
VVGVFTGDEAAEGEEEGEEEEGEQVDTPNCL